MTDDASVPTPIPALVPVSTIPRRVWILGGVTLAATIAASVLLWTSVLRDYFIVKKWGVIVPGLAYRSGQISRQLIKPTLEEHRIQHIICMTSPDADDAAQQAELQASEELQAEHVFLPLNGRGVGNVDHFTGAVTLLTKSIQRNEPVLIHCHAGAQRTGGVVAAYRLLVEQRSPEFVINELKAYGWNARRDQILLEFINEHLREAAEKLVAAGCLERVPDQLPVLR